MTQAFSIDGRSIAFADAGPQRGPVLVYANSLGTDLRVWDAVVPLLPGFRHIRWDKPGHGLSDLAGDRPISAHAADLAALLYRLAIPRAVVVGLSVGGMIAQALAAAEPSLVAGLVLCDTAHRIGPAEMWDARIAAVADGGMEPIADAVMERWFSTRFRADRAPELALWRNMLVRTPADGYTAMCRAIRDADLTEAARGIRVPTLCLAGSEDLATPPALVRSTADLIPRAGFRVIDGVAHLPCIEVPQLLSSLVAGFLEDNRLG
ncbi:MAG: 3-oxoadipate enol-lactonase [Alphaproteobacteria bacterium]